MRNAAELQVLAHNRAEQRSVTVSGVTAQYWYYPATSKSPAKAKDIVMVHGYRGDHHGLESFAGALDDFNVYAPDIPGFGISEPFNEEHTLENYVTWLIDFVSAVKLKNPIAIGHSFGTLMVSSAQSQQKIFSALVCINPVAGGLTKGLSKFLMNGVKGYYWLAHMMPTVIGMGMLKTRLLVDSMSAYTTKSKDKELRKWIVGQHRQHFNSFANSQVVWESYVASISHTMQPYVKNIDVPVFLVAAELDEVTPVEAVIAMAKTMKNAKMYEIKNCGHLVHYEVAEQTVGEIRAFLKEAL
jgi:pimeloyl-ACP methyl ester carboxylesterase